MARRIEVEIVGDSRSLERAFARSEKSAKQFDRQMSTTSTSLSKSFKGGAAALGVSVGLSTLIDGMRGAVTASSNLSEEMSKTNVVFGTSAEAVTTWSQSLSSMGLSTRAALQAASGFGALFGPLGIVGNQAAQQSEQLTQLGVDLASFYNTDVQSALDAVRSGLVGESEPLRKYGVLLSEAKVQAEAMAESGKTSASSLTDQEKVLARVNIIMRESTVAQGDAARSADRYAGQTKTLSANIENLQANVGKLLTPAVLDATSAMNDWLPVLTGIVDQLDRWSKLKIPNIPGGGGGTAGNFLKTWFGPTGRLSPAGLGLLTIKTISGRFGGGGDKTTAGGKGMGGLGSIFDSIQKALGGTSNAVKAASAIRTANSTIGDWVAFINKYATAGQNFGAAQERFAAQQKKAAAHRAQMELQRQRHAAGLENQLGWLEFGVERAEAGGKPAKIVAALRKEEAFWKTRIAHEGRKLRLVEELWRVRQRITDLNKAKAGPSAFHQVSAAKVAGMLGVGGDQSALMLLAALGKGGTLPGGSKAFTAGRGGVVVNGNVHVHGVQNTRQFTDELEKQNRGRPTVRRGAR